MIIRFYTDVDNVYHAQTNEREYKNDYYTYFTLGTINAIKQELSKNFDLDFISFKIYNNFKSSDYNIERARLDVKFVREEDEDFFIILNVEGFEI
jgi:hypothetical protein